jgi:glycerol uptake facilitator-like aquaporin
MAKKLAAECLGTFALVFAGTGAVVIDEVSGGGVSHVGIALTFGLIVLAMIYTLGDISGAHINPAVTIGFWAARRFESRDVLPYVVSQCAGAFLASIVLRLLFPANATFGATIPTGPLLQAFVLELILNALSICYSWRLPYRTTKHDEPSPTFCPLRFSTAQSMCASIFGPPVRKNRTRRKAAIARKITFNIVV